MQEKGLLENEHNFEEDILNAAWDMAERYQCDRNHSSFDNLVLFLRLASILSFLVLTEFQVPFVYDLDPHWIWN